MKMMAEKQERPFSQRKAPHPGISGRTKHQAHNQYNELKQKQNLTLTKTAKSTLRSWAEEYGLSVSSIVEIIARSPKIAKSIKAELKSESERIRELRKKMR